MAYAIVGALISLACISASLRRLALASEVTWLDPRLVVDALRTASLWDDLRAELETAGAPLWERDLAAALAAKGPERVALVNEQLAELDFRAQEWARVPRVCASISSTSGFLLASLTLRAALSSDTPDVTAAVGPAISAVTFGIAGAAFCIAAQARANALVKERLAGVDKLVERLETSRGG